MLKVDGLFYEEKTSGMLKEFLQDVAQDAVTHTNNVNSEPVVGHFKRNFGNWFTIEQHH